MNRRYVTVIDMTMEPADKCMSDECSPSHVPDRDGFPLDRLSDPHLHLRWYSTIYLQRYWGCRSLDLVCESRVMDVISSTAH